MATSQPRKWVVEGLDFDKLTASRVAWEAWEFTLEAPGRVKVNNAAYGYLKADHSYTVLVEERDGLVVPSECECPADTHGESDCKHKVALATVGGPTVLEVAVNVEGAASASPARKPESRRDTISVNTGTRDSHSEETQCPHGNPGCEGPTSSDLPCFDCFDPDMEVK